MAPSNIAVKGYPRARKEVLPQLQLFSTPINCVNFFLHFNFILRVFKLSPRRKFFRKKFSLIGVASRLRHSVNADYEQKITYTLVFFKFIFSVLWRYVDFTKAHRAAKARIFLPVSPQKIRSATLQIKIFLITLSPQKKFRKKYFFVRSDLCFFFADRIFSKRDFDDRKVT